LGTRNADHPSLGLLGDLRGAGPMVGILQPRLSACRQGLVDAFVNRRSAHAQLPLNLADRYARRILEQHPGALRFPHRRRTRARQFRQLGPLRSSVSTSAARPLLRPMISSIAGIY
jgi:hypothetical protein